jgi:hypothetical protein
MEGLTPCCCLGKRWRYVEVLESPGADEDCEQRAEKDV